jgi:hypothetical protein
MTKRKKDKNVGAVRKIAQRTVGLMLRVGDVLEAVAADAEATAPGPVASTARVAMAVPVPVPVAAPVAPAPAPMAETVSQVSEVEAQLPCTPTPPSPGDVVAAPPSAAQEAAVTAVAIEAVDPGARAVAAIEAYATQHNLRAADMPGQDVLVAALAGASADGAELTEPRVRFVMDEQMRGHLRALGARSGTG